jgi:uncharacterized protein with HEPN domain
MPRVADRRLRAMNLSRIGSCVIFRLSVKRPTLPQELRDQRPDIPWTEIIGMRHILVHDYFVIDIDIVWDAIQRDLPDLKGKVQVMLRALESKP